MQNIKFTTRHQKLLKLKTDIEVLRLGQRNKEYIELIETLKSKVIEELRKEQALIGLIPQNTKEMINESGQELGASFSSSRKAVR